MGLLDLDDPKMQGLLGLAGGLLANSGYSRTPVTTAQALGAGMQGYAQNYAQAKQYQDALLQRQEAMAQQAEQHAQQQANLDRQFGFNADRAKADQEYRERAHGDQVDYQNRSLAATEEQRKEQLALRKQMIAGGAGGNGLYGNTVKTVDPDGNIHVYQLSKSGQPVELKLPEGHQVAAETPWDARERDVNAKIGEQTGKAVNERQIGYIDAGISASEQLPNYARMRDLLKNVSTGNIANIGQQAANVFGKASADYQELDSLMKQAILANIKAFGANPTEGERKFLLESTGDIRQSAPTLERLFDKYEQRAITAKNRAIRLATQREDQDALDLLNGVDKKPPAASTPQSGGEKPAKGGTKLVDAATLKNYALKHRMTVDKASAFLSSQGYEVRQ